MTKDELNEVLKEDELYLAPEGDGTFNDDFYVVNEDCVAVEFDGLDFIFARDFSEYRLGFRKEIVTALVEYVHTPIEERKPKPQLYNVVIGRDLENTGFYTAWVKTESLQIIGSVSEQMLYGESRFKFTKEDIEIHKSRLSPIEQSIVDLGTFPVGTDYKKKFAHD